MKKFKKLISITLSVAMLSAYAMADVAHAEDAGTTIYVSAVNGNDSNAGTVDAPLKTIDAARLKARETSDAVTVEIMEGEYRLSSAISFDSNDSNVTYKAYGEDEPKIKGSVEIPVSAAVAVSESDALWNKMTADAKEDAYVIDLAAQNITQEMIADGSSANGQYALDGKMEMNGFYVGGNELDIAQWPNNNDYAEHDGRGTAANSIIYREDSCDAWADSTGWWVGIWMPYDYSYFRFGGVSIDADTNTLTYVENPVEEYDEDQNYYSTRWKAFNLIEEMDVPGEYFVDRENLKLYFYPTGNISNKTLEFEISVPQIIYVKGAENITFDGLNISQTNGYAALVEDSRNIDIKNCTITDIGSRGIYYTGTVYADTGRYYTDENGAQQTFWQYQRKNGSYDCDVENNIIKNIGGTAVVMMGAGDIDTLTPSNNFIKNNIISNVSTKWVNRAVQLGGCGVTFTNNNVSMCRQGALLMYGNDHTVSYNELYNVLTESADCGVIYQGQSDVFRGSKVEYNYIHDALLDNNKTYEGIKDWQVGIYWDDRQTGMEANHNIIKNIKTGFNSNQAGDFVHSFNTSVGCIRAWSLIDNVHGETDVRETQASKLTLAQLAELIKDKELYYGAYDNLEAIVGGTNPIKFNVLEGNLNVNSGKNIEEYNAAESTFTNNVEVGTYESQVDLTTIFVDPANQDFRVKNDSEYASLGVLNENFDIDLIGVQTDITLNAETAPFEKLYPASNESVALKDEYNFSWSPALGANNYKVTVATDENFDEVVFQKETIQTGAVVTGLSDQTTYYWKVEAENTSRELANTWTSVDGVTSFGVNVALYADTETPEMPANLSSEMDSPAGASYSASGIAEELKEGSVGTPIKLSISEDRLDGHDSNWYASGMFLRDANKDDTYANRRINPEANTNYVFSIRARSAEGNTKVGFANVYNYGSFVAADYDAGGVQLGTEWTDFNTAISIGDTSTYRFNYMIFGIVTGAASDYVVYDTASQYLAEEIEYEIDITPERTKLLPDDEINVTAQVLNQVGTTGYLDQDVEWAVVNTERTATIDGAEVVKTQDGAKISISETVPVGNYVIVAMNENITKGIEIEVVNNLEDTPAVEKPANIQSNFHLDGGNSNTGGFTRTDNVEGYTDTNGKQWVANQDKAAGDNWQFGPVYGTLKDGRTFDGVEGDNYVVSVMVKDASAEGVEAPEFGSMYGGYRNTAYLDTYPSGTRMQLTDEWQEYAGTYTLNDATSIFTFGLYLRSPILNGQGFVIDDMYIAPEVAYEIKMEGNTKVTPAEPATFSAEVLNQIGRQGKLDQNIDWIVVDEARTGAVEGFLVEKTSDGVTVSLESAVPNGTYTLIAMSNGIVKGTDLTVVSNFEDTPAIEMPANLISGFDTPAGASHSALSDSDELAQGSVGTAIKIYLANDRLDTYDSNWYASGMFLRDANKDETYANRRINPEANTNYVFSVRARSAEGNTKVGFVNVYNYGGFVLADHDAGGVQLGTEWTDFNTTISIGDTSTYRFNYMIFGIVSGAASDYVVYDTASPYLAEEIAYSMNITADNTTLTPMDEINVSAEVLNQIGTKGNLSQDVEWYVLTADRSTIVENVKVENTEEGATISLDGAVPSGDYALVAVADGFVKGIDIKVISSFDDTETPEMPANLTNGADRTNSAHFGTLSDSDELAQGAVGDAIKVYIDDDRPDTCDGNWYASGIWLGDKNSTEEDKRFHPEANTNYVFSIRAKSIEGNVKVGFANNYNYGGFVTADHDAGGVQLGTEWTDFNTTISIGDTSAYRFNLLTFGIVSGTAADYIIYDSASPYLAEEIAYSVNITGENEIAVGEDAVISAELLNQIGTKGNLSQEFNWLVLNADRTAYADGVTLTENADGTVTVTGAEAGEYTVIAMAKDNGFIKGYTVTVSQEATPAEKISEASFTQTDATVNFKATVADASAEEIMFVIAEFSGNGKVMENVNSVVKTPADANCDLTLENVTSGNTVRAFIWNKGTLIPIDNSDGLALEYIIN